MKLKIGMPMILLMVVIAAFVCITCVNQDIKVLGTEAKLTGLKIESSGTTVITSTASKVAIPIPSSLMDKEDISSDDLYGTDYDKPDTTIGWIDIKMRDKNTDKISGRIRPTLSPGARAQWGIATRTTRPDVFYDTRVPVSLDDSEYIYIKVMSENGEEVNYYRFLAKLLSWATNLQYVRIKEREGKAGADIHGHSTGSTEWFKLQYMETDPLELSIALKEGQDALVVATPFDENATVRYAVVSEAENPNVDSGDMDPTFTPSDQRINIEDQSYLYVEVTAENTIDKEYFRFKVSVGRIAAIANLTFTGGPEPYRIYGLGLPQPDWTKVGLSNYENADQPVDGFGISLTPDDPDAVITWGKIANDNAGQPSWATPAKVRMDGTEALAIKVVSANGKITWYYKIGVVNLAANIKTHPRAAWYYRGTVAKPLTVEMDRPARGTYTYQWYESDSWYGIYGRHGTPLDEKNNITTVNGGPGQYFYLVQPDEPPYNAGGKVGGGKVGAGSVLLDSDNWADMEKGGEPMAWTLTGETGSTYTPRTDWVNNTPYMLVEADKDTQFYGGIKEQNNAYPIAPYKQTPPKPDNYVNFLSGSTNESRYYWVKVTDSGTGLSVVSQRALILTETDPDMDHFIFDWNNLPKETPKKNIKPFTKNGTAEDNVYKIDLSDYPFPADFETKVKDYQICIAHAQYFLPDGRPWTQNWTHGNLHLGVGDPKVQTGSYGELEWWHNNMGANGGSIPLQAPHSSKGGLEVKPTWIGMTPSGDPAKGLPRPIGVDGKYNTASDLPKGIYSMNATDAYPAGVAQGYFAGFIELLEVRFSKAPN